jgi:protein-tyrosine phosphatase
MAVTRNAILAGTPAALAILGAASPAAQAETHAPDMVRPADASPDRAPAMQGGQNFRDLGGYRTLDGRTVRWRMLFRSGAMDRLTPADFDYLDKLGIRAVVDLRSTEERQAAPVRWPGARTPHVLTKDYSGAAMGFDTTGIATMTGERARAVMASGYRSILGTFNDQYRGMFARLLAGEAPLLFNCSAGKDRTGVAAALILTALKVPRETIVEDYLLSNRHFQRQTSTAANDAAFAAFHRLPPDVVSAFMGVDRGYIEEVFRMIDAHPGGADGYLRDQLGLDDADLTTLRRRYTTA